MIKLTDISKTAQSDAPLTKEQKIQFIEAVSTLNEFGQYIYRDSEMLKKLTENLKAIGDLSEKVLIEETQGNQWFDQISVKKDIKNIKDSIKMFEESAKELYNLQRRLETSFENVGLTLSRYFEIK